ncbi:hypothetical protein NDI56_14355 [Haloarcula sp. S1CR25-12]|uniref:Twin-arginine translocation signal domain-containing protein n=1 Tax=Haloarcula saliterrae TaxID=2950534 RepID=A0ABU2FFV3_9EURY|nr:hypothetical protein [Haloarcula sp. S1CR25-12]MDS0260585.1 hypothetical protein [Haloarcula sp. S1CR25-12]
MDPSHAERTATAGDRDRTPTRRQFLAAGGLAALGALAGCGGQNTPHGWVEASVPGSGALYDVAMTDAGPHAVGEAGRIVARTDAEWRGVVADGPNGNQTTLTAVDVTDDARRLWAAGSSGALVQYDTASGSLVDFSAPLGKTSSWEAVAVTGRTGSERVHLVNGSGELLSGRVGPDSVQWGQVSKPTGGESATALDFAGGTGFLTDTGGGIYRTTGDDWTAVGPGLDDTVHDLSATERGLATVVTDGGTVRLFTGYNWLDLASTESALHAVDSWEAHGVAAGVDGVVYELDRNGWEQQDSPTSATIHGVTLGRDTYSDVAVGANNTVMERFA